MTKPNNQPKSSSSNSVTANVSISTDINKSIEFSPSNQTPKELIKGFQKQFQSIRKQKKLMREAQYKLFEGVYIGALDYWNRPDELENYSETNKIPFNKTTDTFAFLLKIIYRDNGTWRRKVSEHARALRYLHHLEINGNQVASQLKKLGGIKKCTGLWAELKRKNKVTKEDPENIYLGYNDLWKSVVSDAPKSIAKIKKGGFKKGNYIFVGRSSGNGTLTLHRAFKAKNGSGLEMLKIAVQD